MICCSSSSAPPPPSSSSTPAPPLAAAPHPGAGSNPAAKPNRNACGAALPFAGTSSDTPRSNGGGCARVAYNSEAYAPTEGHPALQTLAQVHRQLEEKAQLRKQDVVAALQMLRLAQRQAKDHDASPAELDRITAKTRAVRVLLDLRTVAADPGDALAATLDDAILKMKSDSPRASKQHAALQALGLSQEILEAPARLSPDDVKMGLKRVGLAQQLLEVNDVELDPTQREPISNALATLRQRLDAQSIPPERLLASLDAVLAELQSGGADGGGAEHPSLPLLKVAHEQLESSSHVPPSDFVAALEKLCAVQQMLETDDVRLEPAQLEEMMQRVHGVRQLLDMRSVRPEPAEWLLGVLEDVTDKLRHQRSGDVDEMGRRDLLSADAHLVDGSASAAADTVVQALEAARRQLEAPVHLTPPEVLAAMERLGVAEQLLQTDDLQVDPTQLDQIQERLGLVRHLLDTCACRTDPAERLLVSLDQLASVLTEEVGDSSGDDRCAPANSSLQMLDLALQQLGQGAPITEAVAAAALEKLDLMQPLLEKHSFHTEPATSEHILEQLGMARELLGSWMIHLEAKEPANRSKDDGARRQTAKQPSNQVGQLVAKAEEERRKAEEREQRMRQQRKNSSVLGSYMAEPLQRPNSIVKMHPVTGIARSDPSSDN